MIPILERESAVCLDTKFENPIVIYLQYIMYKNQSSRDALQCVSTAKHLPRFNPAPIKGNRRIRIIPRGKSRRCISCIAYIFAKIKGFPNACIYTRRFQTCKDASILIEYFVNTKGTFFHLLRVLIKPWCAVRTNLGTIFTTNAFILVDEDNTKTFILGYSVDGTGFQTRWFFTVKTRHSDKKTFWLFLSASLFFNNRSISCPFNSVHLGIAGHSACPASDTFCEIYFKT